jgi:hypothetical protein
MKITQKDLDYYNTKKGIFDMPSFNEDYNKAHGIPSQQKWGIMQKVHGDKFGICEGKVTMKMIREAL